MLASKHRAVERRRASAWFGFDTFLFRRRARVRLPFSSPEAIPGEPIDGRTATARECQDTLDALPHEDSARR